MCQKFTSKRVQVGKNLKEIKKLVLDSQDAGRERQIYGVAKCLGEQHVSTCPPCGRDFPNFDVEMKR